MNPLELPLRTRTVLLSQACFDELEEKLTCDERFGNNLEPAELILETPHGKRLVLTAPKP